MLRFFRVSAAWCAAVVFCQLAGAADSRPNVIVVMTDDQGFGDLGVHQNPYVRTPNLDQFARDGVQFSRFYVSPVCAPTRASLMTGRYHYRTGVIHTSRGGAKMHGDEVTIAERLQTAGYRTGIFGKWHLGDNYPMRPTEQGFGEALVHKSGAIGQQSDAPSSYFNPRLWHNNEPKETNGYCTDVFFDAALQFIEENRERPFLVYLPTNAPHAPLDVDPRYSDRYKAMGLDDTTARVYGMVENLDENFGRLLAALDRLGLRQNTLVVFLTDNGAQQARFNAGWRGRKGTTYEGGIHVPAFVQWPARVQGKRTIDRIAAHIDLFPTLLDACGVEAKSHNVVDGTSLLPLLTGKASPENWPDRTLFLQCHRGLEPKRYQHIGVVTQQFKLVGYPGTFNDEDLTTSTAHPVLELFDLAADPGEKNNLAAQDAAMTTTLRRAYDSWFEDMRRTRGFAPGVIHLGSDREPRTHLSRYQDGTYVAGEARGWKVKVLHGGRYDVTYLRGKYDGTLTLVVEWNGKSTRHRLPAGSNRITAELEAGEGTLDIWVESADGKRLPFPENDTSGDAILERRAM
jgi:arylsulfatase A-like enzyme